MELCDRIKELRQSRGMTQQQLADRLGVSKQAVSHWEGGRQSISRSSLELLCDIFNVEMDYLMGRQNITMRYLDTEEIHMIDNYRKLSYEQQTMVCNMLGVKRDAESLSSRKDA